MIYNIVATDINDAWYKAIWGLIKENKGRAYRIRGGSFEGNMRLEYYPLVTIEILYPDSRPLELIMPEASNIPNPTSEQYTQEYLAKLVDPSSKHENEDYIYAEYVWPQLDGVLKRLVCSRGDTNQATITVGDNNSVILNDPPCLKVIDFRNVHNTELGYDYLDIIVYFRSWDLWAGFPNNLAALELLREYVMDELENAGFNYHRTQKGIVAAGNGKIIAVSKGLHLYSYVWEYASVLCGKVDSFGDDIK